MEYDFQTLFSDQVDRLEKRLNAFNKALIREYKMSLNVINNKVEQENRGETISKIEDILSDTLRTAYTAYSRSLDKLDDIFKNIYK